MSLQISLVGSEVDMLTDHMCDYLLFFISLGSYVLINSEWLTAYVFSSVVVWGFSRAGVCFHIKKQEQSIC